MGCARSREGHQEWERQLSGKYGRPGVVGQARRSTVRQSVLDARRQGSVAAVAAGRRRDEEGWYGWPCFSRRGQSRGVGRFRCGGIVGVIPLSEEVWHF